MIVERSARATQPDDIFVYISKPDALYLIMELLGQIVAKHGHSFMTYTARWFGLGRQRLNWIVVDESVYDEYVNKTPIYTPGYNEVRKPEIESCGVRVGQVYRIIRVFGPSPQIGDDWTIVDIIHSQGEAHVVYRWEAVVGVRWPYHGRRWVHGIMSLTEFLTKLRRDHERLRLLEGVDGAQTQTQVVQLV